MAQVTHRQTELHLLAAGLEIVESRYVVDDLVKLLTWHAHFWWLARLIGDIARAKADSGNWGVTNNGTAPAARLGDLDQKSENIIAAGDRVAITTARRQGGRKSESR